MIIKLYGIKHCDTMKKAFQWLDEHDVKYTFHDYKKLGVNRTELTKWVEKLGWQKIINTRGSTWRKIKPELKQRLDDNLAINMASENPSIIKRPILVRGKQIICGFKLLDYEQFLESTD